MKEWTIADWEQAQKLPQAAVYLYTPMCGTCAVASKMLNVVTQLLPDFEIGKINLNYAEALAVTHEIESVPCLLIVKNGIITDKVYAFQSVPFLYELFQKAID